MGGSKDAGTQTREFWGPEGDSSSAVPDKNRSFQISWKHKVCGGAVKCEPTRSLPVSIIGNSLLYESILETRNYIVSQSDSQIFLVSNDES